MKHIFALLLSSVLFSGCVTDGTVEIQQDFREDSKYFESYSKNTRKTEVYKNMETRFFIEATYLSPDFRDHFSERLKKLYLHEQPFLPEAGTKAGFFVTISAPKDEHLNLSNEHLWTIILKNQSNTFSPSLIKVLSQKERWEPFFNVTKWSKEYLILFDTPSVQTGDQNKVEKDSLNLTFAHSAAKVEFTF